MIYFDVGGSKLSLAWLAVGVGCVCAALAGLLMCVIVPDVPLSFYVSRMGLVFVLSFGGTLVFPLPSVWNVFIQKTVADAREHWARGQAAVNSVKVEVVADVAPAAPVPPTFKREVPIFRNGKYSGDVIVEEIVNPHHVQWLANTITFIRWADRLNSLRSVDHVTVSVSDPNAWQDLTNALSASGYITKGNGKPTLLHPDWTYAGIVAALTHTGKLVHDDVPPPSVRRLEGER